MLETTYMIIIIVIAVEVVFTTEWAGVGIHTILGMIPGMILGTTVLGTAPGTTAVGIVLGTADGTDLGTAAGTHHSITVAGMIPGTTADITEVIMVDTADIMAVSTMAII